MYKAELHKIFKSPKSILFLIIIIAIPFYDLYLAYQENIAPQIRSGATTLPWENILIPERAAFLAGNTTSHIPQMLLIWILPLYILLIYSDSYISEYKNKVTIIYITKTNRLKHIKTKLKISFCVSFLIAFLSSIINLISTYVFFYKGQYFGFGYTEHYPIQYRTISHPLSTYLLYIMIFSLIVGLCGVWTTCISILFPAYKSTYSISLCIWLAFILFPISIIYIMQPFTEYGLIYSSSILFIYVGFSVAMITAVLLKERKRDVI